MRSSVFSNSGTIIGAFTADSPTLVVDESNDRVGVGTLTPRTRMTVEGALTLKEQASADADTAAYGQLWVKNGTPNTLYFTDDAGTDTVLGGGTAANDLNLILHMTTFA